MGMGDRKMKRYTIGLITRIFLTASALPLIAQGNAVEYVIGDGEWVIVK